MTGTKKGMTALTIMPFEGTPYLIGVRWMRLEATSYVIHDPPQSA